MLVKIYCILILFISCIALFSSCFTQSDVDIDGVPDNIDNCVYFQNPGQEDTDQDGIGDICDNCEFISNTEQEDYDDDNVGDKCDNCPNVVNGNQSDINGDEIGDACSSESDQTSFELLLKAAPDECYYGIGESNVYDPAGFDEDNCTATGGISKINESYIWGMTKYNDKLFIGTGANVFCLGARGYGGSVETIDDVPYYVCEFNMENNTTPWIFEDVRPPSIYIYNTTTGASTTLARGGSLAGGNDVDLQRLRSTIGLRSAGTHDGVVFLAGPGLFNFGVDLYPSVINLFAFDAETGEFLGSSTMAPYSNVRKWEVIEGKLYVGFGGGPEGGVLLKWNGTKNEPFNFEIVGTRIDGEIADICYHEGRIFVSTWPNIGELVDDLNSGNLNISVISELLFRCAGVWMSPVLGLNNELDPLDANQWFKVWASFDYEPDPITAVVYGGGGLASYEGWLYWGTMNIGTGKDGDMVSAAYTAHETIYVNMSEDDKKGMDELTWRGTAVFRGKNFGIFIPGIFGQKIELLYGEEQLPVYFPGLGWSEMNTGILSSLPFGDVSLLSMTPELLTGSAFIPLSPEYGTSGFGNYMNNYTWEMVVHNGKLYVGTYDMSGYNDSVSGADLYCFQNSDSAAVPLNISGFGNRLNYGIRAMISMDDYLYIGTADGRNVNPESGWELIRLKDQ